MYRISSIESVSPSRYLIHLEGGESFPLYIKEADRYGIREGAFLPEEVYHEIMEELLPRRVCHRAVHTLEKMDRTEAQLRRKLESSSYPGHLIDYAVDYVKRLHYLDDVRYASAYIDYRRDSRSRRQLANELRERGVSREDIEEAFAQSELPDEQEQILYWKEKKHYCPEEADKKTKERFYQFLLRRGFSISAIRSVLENKNYY